MSQPGSISDSGKCSNVSEKGKVQADIAIRKWVSIYLVQTPLADRLIVKLHLS